MGLFGAAHGCEGGEGGGAKKPFSKICHTYPTVMKLGIIMPYLKKIKKYLNHVTFPLSSADSAFFHRKSANFAISRNTDTDSICIHNF